MGGISATTAADILYGTDGYVTVDGVDLGATLGDITIQQGFTPYYPDLSQARGNVAGTGIVTDAFFRATVTIAEWKWTQLVKVMGSIGSTSSGDSYKLGGQAMAAMVEVDNVIVTGVQKNGGKDFKATIPKAYAMPGDIVLSEKKETGLQITFEGLFTVSAPTTMPGYIEIEK